MTLSILVSIEPMRSPSAVPLGVGPSPLSFHRLRGADPLLWVPCLQSAIGALRMCTATCLPRHFPERPGRTAPQEENSSGVYREWAGRGR